MKYHLGATGIYKTAHGANVEIHLVSNPSHLEAVNPVAMGRAAGKTGTLVRTWHALRSADDHARRRGLCRTGHRARKR